MVCQNDENKNNQQYCHSVMINISACIKLSDEDPDGSDISSTVWTTLIY